MASAPYVWEAAYLEAFGRTGHVELSCEFAGINSSTVRRARATRPSFAAREAEAKARAVARLKFVAHDRAVNGWLEPQFGMVHGETVQVGVINRFDNRLVEFLLKGLAPEEFSDKLRVQGALGIVGAQIGVKDDPQLLEQAALFLALAVGGGDGDGGQDIARGAGDPGQPGALEAG